MEEKKTFKFDITTVPIGENRTLFVPLHTDGKRTTAIGFFVKDEGQFPKDDFIGIDYISEHLDETTPVVAFNFKNKKSINAVIGFLRFYRDNIYKKDFSVDE